MKSKEANNYKKYKLIKLGKKAFTLTELIAVMVILSLIISMAIALFVNIKEKILQKEYDNLVLYLETKASEYAEETSITTINVENLIKEGKVKPDDETDIYDPRNNKSMNCFIIRSVFENGKYNSTLMEDLGKDQNGKCNQYEVTTDYEICKFENGQCLKFDETVWFNYTVTLGVMYRGNLLTEEDITYNWTSNTGFASKEATVMVDGNLLNSRYKCDVKGKELVGTATKGIKIDKEAPVINEIKYDTNWSVNKKIEIIASDGIGSGIWGYAIVEENEKCLNYNKNKEIVIDSNGKYKVCVKDIAGNETEELMEITSIDSDAPSIVAKSSNNEITVGDNKNVIDYFMVKYSKSGGRTSCNYNNTGNLKVGNYVLTCRVIGGNNVVVEASTNLKVSPRIPSKPNIITKLGNSNGAIYKGTWTSNGIYISMTPGKSDDIVTRYEYKIDNGKWIQLSNLIIKNNAGSFVYTKDVNGTICVRACNEKGCSEQSNGRMLKIDTKSPTIVAKSSNNEIKKGTNNKTSSYFTVTYSASGGAISCTPDTTGALNVGNHTLKCVATGGNGKTAEATTKLKVVPLTPSTPTITTRLESSSGQVYNGTWTNKSIYIEINPGSANDVVTKFEYKIGNGNWITASGTINGNKGSFVYSSEVDNTIYVRNCYQNNCSSASNGKTLKIDKTAPTCKLTANSSKISFSQKATDVQKAGITKNKTADYTNATVNINTGTFYGYVIDKANNTGTCNIEIIETSSSRSCSETCSEGTEVCDLVCYYNASSSEIARKSCNRGIYEPTWETCYSAYYSSCPSTFPNIDWSASNCYTSGGGCTESCTTSYYCKSGYTKINSSYCYK